MLLVKRLALLGAVVAGLALTGCGDEKSAGATQSPESFSITCKIFERSSVESSKMRSRTLNLGPKTGTKSVTVGDFKARAQFSADEFEGRALDFFVFAKGESEPITQAKYQFDDKDAPVNQFVGGHGFSGLVYVNHPTTGAELQYFCETN